MLKLKIEFLRWCEFFADILKRIHHNDIVKSKCDVIKVNIHRNTEVGSYVISRFRIDRLFRYIIMAHATSFPRDDLANVC